MSASSPRSAQWLRVQRWVLARGARQVALALTATAGAVGLGIGLTMTWLTGVTPMLPTLAVAVLCAVTVAPMVAWPVLRLLFDVERRRAQLDVLATSDELTGVHNRRQFLVMADREWSRCRRYNMSAALLMLGVDHFDDINDDHGLLAGDLVLREIARTVGDTLRQPDLCGRFGGDEFVVFLPHADMLGALDAAERIRERVAKLSFEWTGQSVSVTVSVGMAALDLSHDSLSALIQDADEALYSAKDAGGNCVRTELSPASQRGETKPMVLR
jgi:diguanylate cyclase (GGDEF)-like protein